MIIIEQQISILECFLKDHVTLKTGVKFQVSSFKFQVLFVTYTTIQRLYNQQSLKENKDAENILKYIHIENGYFKL